METYPTVAATRTALDAARARGAQTGLVPTMGALHRGHRSLIEAARAECDVVVVSIFVNPLQFGDPDDIERYPRPLEDDLALCADAGVDVVFAPTVPEMYPDWPRPVETTVSVSGVSVAWEGASRPGHFDGVATVVSKLFAIAGPCRAYFGEKDFQQLAVVRRMVRDLSLPVTIVGGPTVREADGLALSSRNVRLSADERRAATVLSRALGAGQAAISEGIRSAAQLRHVMADVVATEPSVALDYAVAVDTDSLLETVALDDPLTTRLLIAAVVGPVRLIDNMPAVPVVSRRESRQLERIG
ncbi:MAG TPA: pantoate--beta-alanine ligase [Acidimicrobiales bacterium]|jgi:pantoate--beta-alanine ligase